MPYVERSGGIIVNTYATEQVGIAEEYLADADVEVVAFDLSTENIESDQENINASLAMEMADITERIVIVNGNRIADSYDSLGNIDTDLCLNVDDSFVGPNGYIQPTQQADYVHDMVGVTLFGDMTGGGGLAAAVDGDTSKTAAEGASKAATSGFVGITFPSPVRIKKVTVTASSDDGYASGGVAVVGVSLHAKAGGAAPVSPTAGTAGIGSASSGDSASRVDAIDSTGTYSAYDHLVVAVGTTSGDVRIANIEVLCVGKYDAMELVSYYSEADAMPSAMSMLLDVQYETDCVLNDDLVCEVSRDLGATYTEAVLSVRRNLGNLRKLLETGTIDVSAQPTESRPLYKISTTEQLYPVQLMASHFRWGE